MRGLLAGLALAGACGAPAAAPPDACVGEDYSQVSRDPYFQSCDADPCPAPYECVTFEAMLGTDIACLLPCCASSSCPGDQGCVGAPDFDVADSAPDGYCADPP